MLSKGFSNKSKVETLVILIGIICLVAANRVPTTEAAASAEMLSTTSYISSPGSYHVIGGISNTGDQPLEDVRATATFYNASGVVVGTSFAYTSIDVILPGHWAPYDVILLDSAQSLKVDHYTVTGSFYVSSTQLTAALQFLSNSSYISYGTHHIVGEIKNLGPTKATYVKVIAVYFNSTGSLIDTQYSYTSPTDLEVNQTAPFDILLFDDARALLVDHYMIFAQSTQYTVVPEFSGLSFLAVFVSLTAIIVLIKARAEALKSLQ